jgi:hypothetical protein
MGETLLPSILRGWRGGFDNNGCCWSCDDELCRPAVMWQVSETLLFWQSLESGTFWYQGSYSVPMQNPPTHLLHLMTRGVLWVTAFLKSPWTLDHKARGVEASSLCFPYCAEIPWPRSRLIGLSRSNSLLTLHVFVYRALDFKWHEISYAVNLWGLFGFRIYRN